MKKLPPASGEKKRNGRPSFEPTNEHRDTVSIMCAIGQDHELIAKVIGIAPKTLRKHFHTELKTAEAKANAMVGGTLFRMATSGHDPAATIFWAKTRLRFRETSIIQNQVLDKDGNPIQPPAFGVSFANGSPGNPAIASGIEISGDVPIEAEAEAERVQH